MSKLKKRAILIDPTNQTVTTITVQSDNLQAIQKVVGGRIGLAGCLVNGDDLISCDDLFQENTPYDFFKIEEGSDYPIRGKCLVVGKGNSKNGDMTHVKSTLADVKSKVEFIGKHIVEFGIKGIALKKLPTVHFD